MILWHGGGNITMSTWSCWRWNLTTSASLILSCQCHGINWCLPYLATSTAVKHVFSKGWQLLHFTCNQLSGRSIHALLCFSNWSRKDLIVSQDVIEAIKHGAGKHKRFQSEVSDFEDVNSLTYILSSVLAIVVHYFLVIVCLEPWAIPAVLLTVVQYTWCIDTVVI